MLILVYLVCILSQTDSVSSSDNNGVYPIENSQRLMLTIPTEIPSDATDTDAFYSTTESLATTSDNLISKNDDIYIGTHPLFPIQEPSTTPMSPIGQTLKPEIENLPEQTIVTTPVPKCSTEEEGEESALLTSTEQTITEDIDSKNDAQETITSTEAIISIPPTPTLPESAIPNKRSLSLDDLTKFNNTSIETATESETEMSTPTNSLEEESTEPIQLSTNSVTLENLQDAENPQVSSTTPAFSTSPPPVSEDNLFMDNWAYHISAENNDLDLNDDDSSLDLNFLKEPSKSLFQNEDSKFATIESPILEKESNESLSLTASASAPEEQQIKSDIEDTSNLRYSDDTEEHHPFFSPQNLLNLFAMDHQPSSSNIKTTWWPKSKSSSMSDLAESAAKNHIKRANRISPNEDDDSQEMYDGRNHRVFRQGFDNLLNRKLKKSVSMLEKLFGNYFLQ